MCMFMFQYSPGNTVNNATSFYSIELITFAHTGKVFCAKDEFEFLKVDLVFAKDPLIAQASSLVPLQSIVVSELAKSRGKLTNKVYRKSDIWR